MNKKSFSLVAAVFLLLFTHKAFTKETPVRYCFDLVNNHGQNITQLNLTMPFQHPILDNEEPEGWEAILYHNNDAILWGTSGSGLPAGQDTGSFCFTIDADPITFHWFVCRAPNNKPGRTHVETWSSEDTLNLVLQDSYLVPTLNQRILIILVILVVGSGIWLMLRKRRVMRA